MCNVQTGGTTLGQPNLSQFNLVTIKSKQPLTKTHPKLRLTKFIFKYQIDPNKISGSPIVAYAEM